MDLSDEKLQKQVDKAHELGIELFVIDDGWFRGGLVDAGYMGDWEVARNKFPNGLRPICDYIHRKGMLAGIWIEPEMISLGTRLHQEHPDYLVHCPNRTPSPGRSQYILDLSRDEVVDCIFAKLEKLIAENGFDYLKWDMNRYLADDYAPDIWVPEFRYRWMLGVYRLHRAIRERFPKLLIEGCASGGARFDLGILSFVDQIWTSDNTDAVCRLSIVRGTSLAYPQTVMGAHVSRIPNGGTGRVYDYETAFNVNAFGAFGYELDVTKLTETDGRVFREQIAFFKEYRPIFQHGRFTPISDDDTWVWTAESADGSVILALYLERNLTVNRQRIRLLRVPSCDPARMYKVTTRPQWGTNPLMCERKGGVHRSEPFERTVPGALLSGQGMVIMPVFSGSDCSEQTAYLGDNGSRLFILQAN